MVSTLASHNVFCVLCFVYCVCVFLFMGKMVYSYSAPLHHLMLGVTL